jgi:hypothetical protein
MDETAREKLAQRLSALSLKDARKEIYRMDPDTELKFFRNSIWDEYHTLFLMPNQDLSVTLVEKRDKDTLNKVDPASATRNRKKQEIDYNYVEARVEPLTRPALKRPLRMRAGQP